jgi:5-methylcytosine-specific restriction endonuclease McrA
MPWDNSPAKRARDAKVYGDPEYKRNRAAALRRSGGRCENLLDNGQRCSSRDGVQVDHVTPVTQHGTHHLDNLRVLCRQCHGKKTAQEGGGYRSPKTATDPDPRPRTNWQAS